VTGGTAGIGRAVVESMLAAGARVAFCSPDQGECDGVARQLSEAFSADRVFGMTGDLRDRASLSAFADAVIARWGRVDTLVCNAASFGSPGPLEETDYATFESALIANVLNNFHLCLRLIPLMAERGSGSVVLVTSITGYTSMPSNVPYSSSKAAIANMARSLAAGYATRGVRVNCVSPGLIKTEASRDLWEDEEAARAYVAERVPMQTLGAPSDIAAACVYLASPMSGYVTGATLPVDGGRLGIGQSAGSAATVKKPR
jgi:NAD(P)-dependent dehydrogenase (short-subunit alcohol dehydrogenase family)